MGMGTKWFKKTHLAWSRKLNIYLVLALAICASAGLIGISGVFIYKYERLQATIIEYEKHQAKLGVSLVKLENKMVKANESHRKTIEEIERDGYVYPACGLYTFSKGDQSCKNNAQPH